ncbi:sulfite exporter TauE/SafE family protein 3-like isoform X2 [Sorghum bicolor]|uniref:sulfite exporter TauE/SafE family protein 3-like isoform X2 n=1 Tax=Sorghum bicolor TaxID=4558 RepID=UPI00081AB289|nr:sulfite exporter TauE/SafE family protein 3-like isoform X2 [Sorghum bicolor]XP_021302721.1 sulfite exporter TauE/SafE family protein 3-like isoform X2 [Sorghum bicolor]|eukprot:XP_021302720.1 sulfite exporter TauE/SafE family protein 3-like isoform X2 [Sorghum bicolor]
MDRLYQEAVKRLEQTAGEEAEYEPLRTGPGVTVDKKLSSDEPSLIENIHCKEVDLLSFVWVAFLVQNYTTTCSPWYWTLDLLPRGHRSAACLHHHFSTCG